MQAHDAAGQLLGLSLEELGRLAQRAADLAVMADYLRRKRAWTGQGQEGAEPPGLPSDGSVGSAGRGA